ncbi:MAG: FtsX-like permease family protein [Ferruginibacter sp.]
MNLLFAWRYFKAKKSANAINIIAWVTVSVIAVATACQVLVLSVFNGFESLVKSLYASFYTDLKITPTKGKTFVLTTDQLKLIKQQPGINAVSLIVEEKALLENDDQQTIVILKGVDDNYIHVSGVASKIISGKFNIGNVNEPGLIVGSGIQSAISINVDGISGQRSLLAIILPKKEVVANGDPLQSLSEGNVKATGVFSIQQDFDNKYAITNIDFLKQQMGLSTNEYSAVEIKLNNPANLPTIQQKLSDLLGTNYVIQSKYQQNISLYRTMKLEKWFIYIVLTLILIIAAFNMVSSLTMLVLEKQKDIGILQSMGADKNRIINIFLIEGILLGTIGASIGVVLSAIICVIQLKYKLIKLEGGSFLIDYFPVKMEVADFLLVATTIGIIVFLASWFPARKAANSPILFID